MGRRATWRRTGAGTLLGILCSFMVLAAPETKERLETPVYARVDIAAIGHQRLEELKVVEGLRWWIEADDQLLILTTKERLLDLEDRQYLFEVLEVDPRPARLFFVERGHRRHLEAMDVDVLVEGGRYAVVQARDVRIPRLPEEVTGEENRRKTIFHGDGLASLAAFHPNRVLSRQLENEDLGLAPSLDENLGNLADDVDGERWFDDVRALTRFNRYAYGRGIEEARDWIVGRFEDIPGLRVERDPFPMPLGVGENVVATADGSSRPEVLVIGAHYDSSSESPQSFAPGAEDDASGCAGVLELARVLASRPAEATIQFVCYSGASQGYLGSRHHASQFVGGDHHERVSAVLILEMISFTEDGDLDSLLEAPVEGRGLIEIWSAAAAQFTNLRIVYTLVESESDHVSYLDRDLPALLTIGNDWSRYPDYHLQTDLPSNLSADLAEQVLRMSAVAIGHMAGVTDGTRPIFRDGFESGDLRRWLEGSPRGDVR